MGLLSHCTTTTWKWLINFTFCGGRDHNTTRSLSNDDGDGDSNENGKKSKTTNGMCITLFYIQWGGNYARAPSDEKNRGKKTYEYTYNMYIFPQGPEEMCLLENQTRRKPLKKWVILIALLFRYTFYSPQPRKWGLARSAYTSCLGPPSGVVPCASEDIACGYWFSKSRSGSDKKRRNRLQ